MIDASEIQRRLQALTTSAKEFNQYVNHIDNNFENKSAEIKNLELRRDRLKEECDASQAKANAILQEASEQVSTMTKEANKLLDEAKNAKLQAKADQERATVMIAESQAQMSQAIQRQKEADTQFRMLEDRKKKIQEAIHG